MFDPPKHDDFTHVVSPVCGHSEPVGHLVYPPQKFKSVFSLTGYMDTPSAPRKHVQPEFSVGHGFFPI